MSSPAAVPATFHERHIPALDGIRGIAIIIVLLHHSRWLLNQHFHPQDILVNAFNLGWCGVDLFFVLSGFLITGILLDSRTSPHYFSTFYMRRFLRIFPLYYGYLALAFLGSHLAHNGLLPGGDPLAPINPWWYLGYVQNFRPNTMLVDPLLGHLWSLAVEEQFYLVWPLLVLLMRRAALTSICLALIPLSLAIRIYYLSDAPYLSAFVNTFTPASLDALAAGALVALAVRSPVWRARAALLARPFLLVSTLWFCILAWRAGTLFEYHYLIQTWGITALTFIFAAIVFVAATSSHGITAAFFELKPLRFTGKISYSLYVLHPLVFALLLPVFAAIPVPAGLDLALNSEKMFLFFVASMVVAAGSWFYFEKPILGLKKYFCYERITEFVQPAATSAAVTSAPTL
ncbi:MAG: acyltransferase [Bryobacterales bacterium]|nr:acyltransferase [Bryobacterales bacterium]